MVNGRVGTKFLIAARGTLVVFDIMFLSLKLENGGDLKPSNLRKSPANAAMYTNIFGKIRTGPLVNAADMRLAQFFMSYIL